VPAGATSDIADVGVHAEGFLEHNEPGAGLASRMSNVGAHRSAIGNRECDEFGLRIHSFIDTASCGLAAVSIEIKRALQPSMADRKVKQLE
jgi:hypothetical protein